MTAENNNKEKNRSQLHPRNPHVGRYDLVSLCKSCPELTSYLRLNPDGESTIDFSDQKAVVFLNKALLAKFYNVKNWQIPEGYLCPPIPGRADYIHYAADLLAKSNNNNLPQGKRVNVLDIGTGANCIYPIVGSHAYDWKFVGTDIDPVSVKTAKLIVESNSTLAKQIRIIKQINKQSILKGIIDKKELFDLTLCNPPFHSSPREAQEANLRKLKKLNKGEHIENKVKLNFGGNSNELWCPGGELAFIKRLAVESAGFSNQILWFTSLVSKGDNLNSLKKSLNKLGARQIEIMKMSQGQKISHFIGWSFLSQDEQEKWAEEKWQK